jgi:hypothetical protein
MSDINETMRDEPDREPTQKLSTAEIAGQTKMRVEDEKMRVEDEERSFAPDRLDRDEAPLLADDEISHLRERWTDIQAGFVDEPRKAVEDADSLVAQAMKRLAEMFANERSQLEGQWDRGDQVSTEELRIALQRYRSFFPRLMSV